LAQSKTRAEPHESHGPAHSVEGDTTGETDPHADVCGVLLSDEIRFYIDSCDLIEGSKEGNVKPASYDLSLGDEVIVGGVWKRLTETDPFVVVPPHEVATVSTVEELNMPRFLVGRWNLRIALVYKGLLWVGGPQVDPGYRGKLFCPLYNMSDKEITLRYQETFASIDFSKTSPFRRGVSKEFKPKRTSTMSEYDANLRSGPRDLIEKLQDLKGRCTKLEDRVLTFQQVTFTMLGILVATVAIMAGSLFSSSRLDKAFLAPLAIVVVGTIAVFVVGMALGRISNATTKDCSGSDGGHPSS
jgi:deoxycytidine triphosphate deaminase